MGKQHRWTWYHFWEIMARFRSAVERQTLAQVLRGSSYTTAVAGKWQFALLQRDGEEF